MTQHKLRWLLSLAVLALLLPLTGCFVSVGGPGYHASYGGYYGGHVGYHAYTPGFVVGGHGYHHRGHHGYRHRGHRGFHHGGHRGHGRHR